MANIPNTMRSLVAPRKCNPDQLEVRDMPTPSITDPEQVLVRLHACGLFTGDMQIAAGQFDIIHKFEYPLILGQEGSGVVVATGSDVKNFKVGDEVYGSAVEKPLFSSPRTPFSAQYTVVKESFLRQKPKNLSFEEAASLSGFVITAIQVIRRGLEKRNEDSLQGKTVFIPAGLSATGSILIQVAKNVFGAKKIITTVSTAKVPLVEEYLPGMVDHVVDYKTQRVQDVVPRGSIDFAVNTQFGTIGDCVPLLNPETGTLMSVASAPSKETAKTMFGDKMPWWLGLVLGLASLYYKWLTWGTNLEHEFLSGSPGVREDVERAGEIVAQGKVKPVIRVVDLDDMKAVRKGCNEVYTRKGGVGRLVLRIP